MSCSFATPLMPPQFQFATIDACRAAADAAGAAASVAL
jgi:hypothetical protein